MFGRLSKLRRIFVAFYKNPQDFLDMSTLTYQYGQENGTIYEVRGRSFEDVTGLKRLGSGAYADVYAIDENRVLKVIKSEDSGYARFVEQVVRKLPDNPYLPKIFYQGVWADKQVYILERLSETYTDVEQWCIDNGWNGREIRDYRQRKESLKAFKAERQDIINQMDEQNTFRSRLNDDFRSALRKAIDCEATGNRFFSIADEIREIGALLDVSNTHSDMHSGNVMFRGDIPVLTDPTCE